MLLVTGATGLIGTPLVRRLTALGRPVRCLVRDPRRLGPERVRVQIALGDLSDPPSFRNALRGVRTVVHLAGSLRDQRRGSIEELNGVATWRMAEAAERAGIEHFVFLSALGATAHDRTRFLRAKALAERAVLDADMPHTVVAPSVVYAPRDRLLTLLERLSLLPLMPVAGRGRALSQPIWAEDVADCLVAVVERGPADRARLELAGPETLSHEALVRLVLRAARRRRRLAHVPTALVARALGAGEALLGSRAPLVWDEAELLVVSMTTPRGTEDAESLGVVPRPMAAVLGAPGAY